LCIFIDEIWFAVADWKIGLRRRSTMDAGFTMKQILENEENVTEKMYSFS
jgi:hypothetical protein